MTNTRNQELLPEETWQGIEGQCEQGPRLGGVHTEGSQPLTKEVTLVGRQYKEHGPKKYEN